MLPAAIAEELLIPSTSTSGDRLVITFAELLPVPHRDRPIAKRPRIKPPSYELTSVEVLKFISNKLKPLKSGKEKSSKKATCNNVEKLCQKKKSKNKQKKKNKKEVKAAAVLKGSDRIKPSNNDSDNTPCALCRWNYGDISDPLIEDHWEMCVNCKKWYHHSCAYVCGKFCAGAFYCDNNCM